MRIQTGDDLCTPDYILECVRRVGPIGLDPCSNEWSIVGAKVSLDGSPGQCGLAADWLALAAGELAFVNPSYGRGFMPKWAKKITHEAQRGVEIIALVKGDHSTKWHHILRGSASAMAYLSKRPPFLGGEHEGGTFASTLFYYGPRPHLFCHSFSEIADPRPLS